VAASESGDTSSPTSVPPESDGPEMIDQEADEQEPVLRTTRSGKAFGVMQSRKSRLRQEAIDDPDMEVEDEEEDDDEADEDSFEAGEC
jgi:hypothetical protein